MKPMTKSQKEHAGKVADLGCIVCYNLRWPETPAEIHHLNGGFITRSHEKIIGLCPRHHRNGGYEVAIHAGRKAWEKRYGTQQELLIQVEELLT